MFLRSTKRFFWLFFFLILALTAFLRLYQLGHVPVSLYWDEAAMYLDIKSILQSGSDVFGRPWYQVIYPSYGDFKSPVYIWLALLTSKILGLSSWSFRLPSALAGIGTVVVAGFLAKEVFSTRTERKKDLLQLLTMLVVTISPWSMLFSRTGFEGHLGQFFLSLSILCTLLVRKKKWLILLVPIFAALGTYTYFSVRFVWLAVFAITVALYFFRLQKRAIRTSIFVLGLPLVFYALLVVPLFQSSLYKDANTFRLGTDSVLNQNYTIQSNIYRELAGNSRVDRLLFNSKVLMIRSLAKNYAANASLNFLFISGDPNLRHGTQQHGLFLWIFLPFFLYGGLQLWIHDKRALALLFAWWMIAMLPASVPLNVPHALRSLNALVPLSLWIGFGLFAAVNDFARVSFVPRVLRLGTFAALLLGISFTAFQFFFFYFRVYPTLSAYDWQDGYQQLATAVYAQRTSDQDIIIVPFDDRFYIWLMAFGPYTASDFHNWKSEQYHFLRFGDEAISFVNINDESLLQHQKPTIVAGKKKDLQEQLSKMKLQPQKVTDVAGSDPAQAYQILEFSR